MNPAASSMIQEIEQVLIQNSHQVGGDSIPTFKQDIREVSRKTAESLLDCSFDQKVRNTLLTFLPSQGKSLLEELTKERTTRELMLSQGRARSMSYRS